MNKQETQTELKKDVVKECDPEFNGADCDKCPNPCEHIDACEYCICPIECSEYKRRRA